MGEGPLWTHGDDAAVVEPHAFGDQAEELVPRVRALLAAPEDAEVVEYTTCALDARGGFERERCEFSLRDPAARDVSRFREVAQFVRSRRRRRRSLSKLGASPAMRPPMRRSSRFTRVRPHARVGTVPRSDEVTPASPLRPTG